MKKDRTELVEAGASILITPGEMIRELRELKGWSQLDLVSETGISQTNISAIVLAEALSVHPAAIMFADYDVAA